MPHLGFILSSQIATRQISHAISALQFAVTPDSLKNLEVLMILPEMLTQLIAAIDPNDVTKSKYTALFYLRFFEQVPIFSVQNIPKYTDDCGIPQDLYESRLNVAHTLPDLALLLLDRILEWVCFDILKL